MQFVSSDCLQLNQFYKENKDKARAKPSDLMYAALDGHGQVCAVLRLLPYDGFLFLRSVHTSSKHRGKGIASGLIDYSIRIQTKQADSLPIYTLPTELALPLYHRLGFQPIKQEHVPAELLASYRRFRQSGNDSTVMVINP